MDTSADAASTRKVQALIQAEAARRAQEEAERLASDAAARSTLLPCPFCGGAVKIQYVSGSYGYTYGSVRIECKACKSTGSVDTVAFSQDTEAWAPGKGTYSIRDQATNAVVARWNRRAA